jgi:hypothetical protein
VLLNIFIFEDKKVKKKFISYKKNNRYIKSPIQIQIYIYKAKNHIYFKFLSLTLMGKSKLSSIDDTQTE